MNWSESRKNSMEQLVESCQKAMALDDSIPMLYTLQANIYLMKKQFNKALAEGERAVSMCPNCTENKVLLGHILRFMGKPEEAIQVLKQAIRLDPFPTVMAYHNLAMSYVFAGMPNEALETFRKALKVEPNNLPANLGLAVTYASLGREEDARIDGLIKAGLPEIPPLPLPDKPSIAVLPFVNMSGDPEQEYFSDGITEEIITALSKTPKLFVIARNSTFTYKGKPVKVQQVGRELGVGYLLEGSVRKAGNKVRITAQLVDAKTGHHLWAERYDRELKDIFAAYALLGKTCILDVYFEWSKSPKESLARAFQLAKKALALDESNIGAHRVLSHIYLLNRQHEMAIAEGERAVSLAPNAADELYNLGLILRFSGRAKEAISMQEKAIRLNPLPPASYLYQLGLSYTFTGEFEKAIAICKKALRQNPDDLVGRITLAIAYSSLGRKAEARAEAAEVLRIHPKFSLEYASKTWPYKNRADKDLVIGSLRKVGLK